MANKANEYNYLIVYNYIKDGCLQNINTIEVQNSDLPEDGIILNTEQENPEDFLIRKDEYNHLSTEAKEIINIILNSPQEILELFITPKRKNISISRLKVILSKCWNSSLMVESAFKEIKRWVKKL